uniref:RNA-binding protein 14 n=1 Tax=Naja naja TaxID=35670 RepID=A0A8C6VIA5_NAJNA
MVKIFVGGLSPVVTAEELRKLFEQYGQVNECDILKNFAFVHMEKEDEAHQAISTLHKSEFYGTHLTVEYATSKIRNATKIYVGNVSAKATTAQIRQLFERFGKVVECDIVKNFAFVHMAKEREGGGREGGTRGTLPMGENATWLCGPAGGDGFVQVVGAHVVLNEIHGWKWHTADKCSFITHIVLVCCWCKWRCTRMASCRFCGPVPEQLKAQDLGTSDLGVREAKGPHKAVCLYPACLWVHIRVHPPFVEVGKPASVQEWEHTVMLTPFSPSLGRNASMYNPKQVPRFSN